MKQTLLYCWNEIQYMLKLLYFRISSVNSLSARHYSHTKVCFGGGFCWKITKLGFENTLKRKHPYERVVRPIELKLELGLYIDVYQINYSDRKKTKIFGAASQCLAFFIGQLEDTKCVCCANVYASIPINQLHAINSHSSKTSTVGSTCSTLSKQPKFIQI